jgi:hypothetical protein
MLTGNPARKIPVEKSRCSYKYTINTDMKKCLVRVYSGFIWLRIEACE